MPSSSFDRIVALINDASLTDDVETKVTKLLQVKELTIHHETSLLDNFFEEVAAFQHDTNIEVRKVVISFIQDACYVDPTLLKKAVGYLFYLFSSAIQQDPPAFNLLQCLTLAMIPIYRIALTRAVKVGVVESGVTIVSTSGIQADSAADVALETFRNVAGLKDEIIRLFLPSTVPGKSVFSFLPSVTLNNHARLGVTSLIESVIILHSRRQPNSDIPREHEGDISLDQIPDLTNAQLQAVLEASTAASSATLLPGICLVRPRRLTEEAERLFAGLLDAALRGQHSDLKLPNARVSCDVLEALMDALVTVARQRPQFMTRVVEAFETVHVTLPPYFSDVQVNAVRKKLKTGLLQLLRHSSAVTDFQGRITILLTDLGATQKEVVDALQQPIELHRPPAAETNTVSASDADHGDVDMRHLRSAQPSAALVQPTTLVSDTVSYSSASKTNVVPVSSASSASSTLTDPRLSSVVTKYSLAETEAAFHFDDDDDEDDEDFDQPIVRKRRSARASRSKRSRNTASTSGTSELSAAAEHKIMTDGKPESQVELPQVDFVTTRLVPRLTSANVADLVLLSMVTLPDQMPAAFQSTYTPIAAAGTTAQIRHLARLLAVQLVVWAGETNQSDPRENLSQLESLLRLVEEELGGKSMDIGDSVGGIKDAMSGRSKKRHLVDRTISKDHDAEAEDAMLRANAARRMHGIQPMNITTLVNYGQQQLSTSAGPTSTASSTLCSTATTGGSVSSLFTSNLPSSGLPAKNAATKLLSAFDPSQPPPSLMGASNVGSGSAFTQLAATMIGSVPSSVSLTLTDLSTIPLPARPFSLDAVTMPLDRSVQRQLARDAFMRILEGLEDPASARRSTLLQSKQNEGENQLLVADQLGSSSTTSHQMDRMKLLTRLTTRRFGGNEFYNILIDYAIKNLRCGFELLSKLLMQEYCRYHGFQLVGFNSFLSARRQKLRQQRDKLDMVDESEQPDRPNPDESADTVVSTEKPKSRSDNKMELSEPVQANAELNVDASDSDQDSIELDQIEEVYRMKESSIQHKLKSDTVNETPKEEPVRSVIPTPNDLGCLSFYDCLLIDILQRLAQPDVRQSYFGRFLIEAPLLTSGALSVLKRYCWTPSQTRYGFQILRTLIEIRPVSQRGDLLNMMLNFCAVEDREVRQAALAATRELAAVGSQWQYHIEEFAISSLKKLLQPRPTADIYPFRSQSIVPISWNDASCQVCANLFLGLMPQNPTLMYELAEVYVGACPEVKRCILRAVDVPIREIGLYSQALHDLVDQCPTGAETLVTRMIHLLTDSQAAASMKATLNATVGVQPIVPPVIVPPISLVKRVYRMYSERVYDIRCLIPVLVGLSKAQVISALPKLVQQSEKVVKEVITRLLHSSICTQYAARVESVQNVGDDQSEDDAPLGPLKPEELLVAIHLLEFAKDPSLPPTSHANPSTPSTSRPFVSLQAILHACRVCFTERRLFTQERLSAAIGQLLEQPVLPTLFMRTVMQALALHPRLAGYVINVLVRLIRKQVWKSEKLWDGFIRCCVKTRPQSYQVLLQLPPERLESVFEREKNMRAQVRRYVENFSSAQRIHVSKSIIEVLERPPTPPPSRPSPDPDTSNDNVITIEAEVVISPHEMHSPFSSGPATPTRDEMPPLHEVIVPTNLVQTASLLMESVHNEPFDRDSSSPIFMTDDMHYPPPSLSARLMKLESPDRSTADRFVTDGDRQQTLRNIRPRERSPHSEEPIFSPSLVSEPNVPTTTESDAISPTNRLHGQIDESPIGAYPLADDSEPPILISKTKVVAHQQSPKTKKPRMEHEVVDFAEVARAQLLELVDQSPLDWSTEDNYDNAPKTLPTPPIEPSTRSKRPVDLQKLEADRKRLEEEAMKHKKLRSKQRKHRRREEQPVSSPPPTSGGGGGGDEVGDTS